MEFKLKENASRKLTLAEVLEIRQWAAKGATHRSLADHYGVTSCQIGRIVRGESWKTGARTEQTPHQKDEMLRRLMAVQRAHDESPDGALKKEADFFQSILDEPRAAAPQREFVWPGRVNVEEELTQLSAPSVEIPLSPLDGGDIPDAVEGAVDVLQDKARAQGVDIDKLLK